MRPGTRPNSNALFVSVAQLNSRAMPIGRRPKIAPRTTRLGFDSTTGPLNVQLGQIFQLLGNIERQKRLECLFMHGFIANYVAKFCGCYVRNFELESKTDLNEILVHIVLHSFGIVVPEFFLLYRTEAR